VAASAEREDMICLNDRLGDIVRKVENLRTGSGQDSSTFIRTIDCLKEEIKKIKTAYDLELSRLRCVSVRRRRGKRKPAIADKLLDGSVVLRSKKNNKK